MGTANGLPETILAVAALRRGALTLAMAAILGGNAFDVLNLVVGDIAFRDGSLYHAATTSEGLPGAGRGAHDHVIVAGLLRRERHGPANIGFQSVAVLLIYLGSMLLLWLEGE